MDVMEQRIRKIASTILPLDEEAMKAARERLDRLTKPPGSLGKLEKLAVQLAGITGEADPGKLKKAVVVMAGDHGVCEEGVSAYPAAVTPQMVLKFLDGGAAINVLARQTGADVVCVDIGVNAELAHERLVAGKIRRGTGNMTRELAMTREEAVRAIVFGIELAGRLNAEQGYRLFATGEMGIGNTTPSAAMLAVFTGTDAEETAGRGTGLDDAGVANKRDVIRRAIALHRPDARDALDVLSKVGGLEIAGLAGLIIGAAANGCPIVVDGFISSVAALTACRLAPGIRPYLIPSHLSEEHGHSKTLEALGLEALLRLDMRLGEGTGAALAFPLIDAAGNVLREMATFESAGVSRE